MQLFYCFHSKSSIFHLSAVHHQLGLNLDFLVARKQMSFYDCELQTLIQRLKGTDPGLIHSAFPQKNGFHCLSDSC